MTYNMSLPDGLICLGLLLWFPRFLILSPLLLLFSVQKSKLPYSIWVLVYHGTLLFIHAHSRSWLFYGQLSMLVFSDTPLICIGQKLCSIHVCEPHILLHICAYTYWLVQTTVLKCLFIYLFLPCATAVWQSVSQVILLKNKIDFWSWCQD